MAALTATAIPQVGAAKLLGFVVAVILVVQLVRNTIRRSKTTQLPGPPSPNRLFGITSLLESNLGKTGELYDGWAEQYGPVYKVPTQLGGNKIVLYDPKAIAYFNAHETTKFLRSGLSRRLIEQGLGHGLLWAEGDDHKRQRKALSPAFSNAAVRNVTSVFFDSGYKVKTAWDNIIQNSGKDSAVIDVAKWLGHVSLDSIGIAGFGYNFGTLEGRPSAAADAFEAFSDMKPTALEVVVMMLAFVFPILSRIPFKGRRLTAEVNRTLGIIGEKLLDNTRNEKWQDRESNAGEDKSIIGLLLKAEKSQGGGFTMTKEEIVDQMKLLIFAGYDTTSIVLTWALLELCRHPDVQTRLRKELEQFSGTDPTSEELMHGLPYLDAIVHETLRLHGPVSEAPRVAASDEVIPLSQPLTLPSGEIVNNIVVCKGQLLTMSIHGINRSPAFWGPDAKAFKPERWLNPEGTPLRAQEIQGHRHLLAFSDGPRICIGRAFALAEFKSVLSVLIRNYAFEFKSGIEPEIDTRRALLPRPGMKGEPGVSIPLVTTHEHAKLLPSVDYAGPDHNDIKGDPEGGDPSSHLAATLSSHALCLPQATVRETVLAIGIRPRLPQELTDVVLDFLWDNDSALRACALVCRAWHLYAVRRGFLAGHLHLETASALSSLIKCLPTDAKRLSEVHSVKLTEAPHAATPWLHRAAPQLGRALEGAALLVLRNWRPARAPGPLHPLIFLAFAQFRAVDTLYLSHCTFASAAQFQRLLGEFPQLRDLTLVGVYVLARGSTSAPVHAPPALECLWLGNSHLARPGEDEEPVAGCLAGWFAGNEATLEALRELRLRITHDLLREGELASFGRLVEVVAPRIRWLRLDFAGAPSDTPSPAADWQGLKLEHCERVRILRVFRSTAALHELSLLSPQCRIEVLELRRWTFRYGKKTDWAALATALERDVFSKLKKVVDARLLQGPEETRELEVFIGRMQRRGVEFEDRTESPFWDWH